MSNTISEHSRFARASSREYKHGPLRRYDSFKLALIQFIFVLLDE
jgi:hypothetical protein